MTKTQLLEEILATMRNVFKHIWDIHWDQHQRKLLLETFTDNTIVIHSDYSVTYDIKNS